MIEFSFKIEKMERAIAFQREQLSDTATEFMVPGQRIVIIAIAITKARLSEEDVNLTFSAREYVDHPTVS